MLVDKCTFWFSFLFSLKSSPVISYGLIINGLWAIVVSCLRWRVWCREVELIHQVECLFEFDTETTTTAVDTIEETERREDFELPLSQATAKMASKSLLSGIAMSCVHRALYRSRTILHSELVKNGDFSTVASLLRSSGYSLAWRWAIRWASRQSCHGRYTVRRWRDNHLPATEVDGCVIRRRVS